MYVSDTAVPADYGFRGEVCYGSTAATTSTAVGCRGKGTALVAPSAALVTERRESGFPAKLESRKKLLRLGALFNLNLGCAKKRGVRGRLTSEILRRKSRYTRAVFILGGIPRKTLNFLGAAREACVERSLREET